MLKTKEVEHVCSSSNQHQQADEEFLRDARSGNSRSNSVKNPFEFANAPSSRGFWLDIEANEHPPNSAGGWPVKLVQFAEKVGQCGLLIAFLMMPVARAQAPQGKGASNERECVLALGEAQRYDFVKAFGYIDGVADFIDAVRTSDVGKSLDRCQTVGNAAWTSILEAVKTDTTPSLQKELRTAALLVIYAQPAYYPKLQEFLRLRPWTRGFQFASSIVVDAVLAHWGDSKRDKVYHRYSQDEMEQVRRKYAP